MKTLRAFPLLAVLALGSGNALASSPAGVHRYDVKLPQSSTPAGAARTTVAAPPEVVKSVVMDFAHYSGFIQRFEKSRVVRRKGGQTDVYLEVPILKRTAKIWAVVRFDAPTRVGDQEIIKGRMVDGNVKKLDANWKLRKTADNKTELELELLIVPNLYVPDTLLLPEVRYAAFKAVAGTQGEAHKRLGGS